MNIPDKVTPTPIFIKPQHNSRVLYLWSNDSKAAAARDWQGGKFTASKDNVLMDKEPKVRKNLTSYRRGLYPFPSSLAHFSFINHIKGQHHD